MNVLIACEESQRVCIAYRLKGYNAFSCDILPCSGGHPEWHIQHDVLPVLNGWCVFRTCDGAVHSVIGKWDMIIAFPPCTFLTNAGNRWFNIERYGDKAIQRLKDRQAAAEFFMYIWNANCDIVIIENPIGYMSTYFRKPDQIIHPYYFAEKEDDENCERKATCFWFRGVEPLKYQIKFMPRIVHYKNGKGTDSPWHINTISLPAAERAIERSKTYNGVAKAMSEQWGVR